MPGVQEMERSDMYRLAGVEERVSGVFLPLVDEDEPISQECQRSMEIRKRI
jgi:hypothetical protein